MDLMVIGDYTRLYILGLLIGIHMQIFLSIKFDMDFGIYHVIANAEKQKLCKTLLKRYYGNKWHFEKKTLLLFVVNRLIVDILFSPYTGHQTMEMMKIWALGTLYRGYMAPFCLDYE